MIYGWLRKACFGSFVGLTILVLAGCGSDDNGSGGVVTVTYGISGQVTLAGSGLSGVTMTLSGAASATTTTNASGNYAFTGLDNGSYTVTPGRTGFTFDPANSPQTVSGANVTAVNFTATSTQSAQIVPCPPSGTTNVTIQDFSYTPDNVTISANGIVKWTNNGLTIHTVTSGTGGTTGTPDGKFDSGNLAPGQTVCMQFLAPGTYPYFCIPHPFMIGSVTVTASSTVITKIAALDNTQETPATNSTAKGGGILTVDTATGKVSGFVASTGVTGAAAHIHSAARGVPGGVILPLVGGPDIWIVPDNATLSPANVTGFQNGNLYFNIHSAAFPDGEIRGQIDMTPTAIRFAALDNTQETPATSSAAKGGGFLAVDTATGKAAGFSVSAGVTGVAAHIHSAARGVPGGVIQPLVGGPSHWFVPDNATLSPTNVTGFQNGNLYFNIHSAAFPDGEIRGQIDFP